MMTRSRAPVERPAQEDKKRLRVAGVDAPERLALPCAGLIEDTALSTLRKIPLGRHVQMSRPREPEDRFHLASRVRSDLRVVPADVCEERPFTWRRIGTFY